MTSSVGEPALPLEPTVSFFLQLPGIPGSVAVKGFEGQIELLTWSWGTDSEVLHSIEGSHSSAIPSGRPLMVAGRSGIHSPALAGASTLGTHLATAQLTCVRSGSRKTSAFMTLAFTDLLVTRYGVTPGPRDGVPYDRVELAYRSVTESYRPQSPDGKVGTPVSMTFDYTTGAGS